MEYTESGTLVVQTLAASGALPIAGSVVVVKGTEEENRFEEHSRITDEDGLTGIITLPTPARSYSMSPASPEKSYANYDVTIIKDGFYTKEIRNIAIFSGVEALLPVTMLPFVPYNEGGLYPRGNVNAVSEENERLE